MNYDQLHRHAEILKKQYPPGSRLELISMSDPYAPVESGTRGSVTVVDDIGTLHMKFDNGRTLGIVPGEDQFRMLTPEEVKKEQLEVKIQTEIMRACVPDDYDAVQRIREYVTAVENGRPLVADGLQEGYKIICEYGRHVLAGMKYSGSEAAHGYQFATWEYSPDKSSVAHGHYYPTWSQEFGSNALEAAKEDFAIRSGLVQEEKIFAPEQFKDIQHALHYYSDECSTISADTYESIRSIIRQIGHALPVSEPIQEPMQEPTMDM